MEYTFTPLFVTKGGHDIPDRISCYSVLMQTIELTSLSFLHCNAYRICETYFLNFDYKNKHYNVHITYA